MKRVWCVVGAALACSFLALALIVGIRDRSLAAAPGQPPDASSLSSSVLISPEDLMKAIQSVKGEKPLTIFVGFQVLYPQAHVPSAEYIGPASRQEYLEKLRKRVALLVHKRFIVLYCGCCPWNHCPNVRPAYEALHNLGFTNVKVLYIPNDFGRDWVNKGLPVEKGQ